MTPTTFTNPGTNQINAYAGNSLKPTALTPTSEYADTFDWGYQGHGPLETAKAILTAHAELNNQPAPAHAEIVTYTATVISRLGSDWTLTIST